MARAVIRAVWKNPAEPRVTIERLVAGRLVSREVGPRGLLDLDEAAALTGEPRSWVERAIRLGDLRVSRAGGRRRVTLQALARLLREDAADGAYADAHKHEPTIPAEQVYRRLGL